MTENNHDSNETLTMLQTGTGEQAAAAVPEEFRWLLYRKMLLIRRVEESLLELYSRGLLFGTVHTCIGQEVCGVGVTQALDPTKDVVWSNHRGHGHFLAFTGDPQGLLSEILGKASGVCGGIGGSQHLHGHNFYTNGILGGTVPCAVGCAFAEKFNATGAVVVVFLGDGALGEGIVYESLNIASLWALPVLFVLEDNGYAQSTPAAYEQAGDITTRAESFSIPITRLNATDVLEVWQATRRIVGDIRRDSRPQMLTLQTYRLAAHSKGDDNRDPHEVAAYRAMDPLRIHRDRLRAEDRDRLERLDREVVEDVERFITAAMNDKHMDVAQFIKQMEG